MSETIGRIDWGAHDGGLIEQLVAVMLLQSRRRGWRRRPSRGDAGVDVANPINAGFEVFQIKSYTGRLTAKRKSDIEASFRRVTSEPELPAPVRRWELVLPMDQSKEAEKWFRELTEAAQFECLWRGSTYLDGLAAEQPQVVNYYLRDGKARLEQRLRDLGEVAELLGSVDVPLRPAEVVPGLTAMFAALNRDDPHYLYEFEVGSDRPNLTSERSRPGVVMAFSDCRPNGGCVTVRVVARYAQATEDRPIGGSFNIHVSEPDLLEAVRDSFDFGSVVELPDGTVTDLRIDAPGGLSRTAPLAGARIGPAQRQDFSMPTMRLRVLSPDDVELAETKVNVVNRTSGRRGADLELEDMGGAFTMVFRLTVDEALPRIDMHDLRIDHSGKLVSSIHPGLRLLSKLHAPNRLEILLEHGPSQVALLRCEGSDPPVTGGYRRVVRALDAIQSYTPIQLKVPAPGDLTIDLAQEILEVSTLLEGAMTSGKWSQMTVSVPAEQAVGAIEGPLGGAGVAFELPLMLRLPTGPIELGTFTLKLLSARVANADEIRDQVTVSRPGDLLVITLEPGDGDARYEAVPGSLPVPGAHDREE